MMPTVHPAGDVMAVERWSLWMGTPFKRGEIVTAHSPTSSGVSVCKRVVGVGGDIVTLQGQGRNSTTIKVGRAADGVLVVECGGGDAHVALVIRAAGETCLMTATPLH
jgi:signal peptidase I